MSDISSYLLSIVGVVLLGVLINLILPEGSMSKYIQNIFALIIVFVIISPIATLIKNDFNISSVIETSEVSIDTNFIYLVNRQTAKELEFIIKNDLKEEGYSGVSVAISINMLTTDFIIEKLEIDLTNLVMNEKVQHINKYSKIKEVILENLSLEEEKIVFYE